MSSTALFNDVHQSGSNCQLSLTSSSPHSVEPTAREASTNEVLDFYRKKVTVLASDSENFQKQLDKIAEVIDHQYCLRLQLREGDEIVMKLRNQVSELQAALHAERDHVLSLYAENDRLKLREIDDRKKIEQLQRLAALSPAALRPLNANVECSSAGIVHRPYPLKDCNDDRSRENTTKLKHETVRQDLEDVQRSLFTLRKQLSEQSRASEDRIQSLLADQERRIKEEGERNKIYQIREAELLHQLKRCQLMLQETANEYLHLRLKYRLAEKTWIAEKEQFLGYVSLEPGDSPNQFRKKSNSSHLKPLAYSGFLKLELFDDFDSEKLDGSRRRERELRKFVEALELQFDQQLKVTNQFRKQLVQVKEDNQHIRQKFSRSTEMQANKIKQLKERNQICERRYEELDRRRRLEIEGYQTDISSLKKKLVDTEAKLRQVTKFFEIRSTSVTTDRDCWMMLESSAGSQRSEILAEELWKLKHMMLALNMERM